MQRWKLVATATVASGLLAGGMLAAFNLTAQATGNSCTATEGSTQTTELTCTVSGYTVSDPESMSLVVTTDPDDVYVDLSLNWYCTDSVGNETSPATPSINPVETSGSSTDGTATYTMAMPLDDPASCTVTTATATVDSSSNATPLTVSSLELDVDDVAQPASSPTASPTPSPTPSSSSSSSSSGSTTTYYHNQVQGFDGMCLDDKGNSSSERAEVILWGCNDTDQAQGWSYSGSELKIHGKCVNAKGNGKSGSRLILWNCTGSANEIFSHRSNGEYAEKANGWTMCINDPAYSTKNGTQLFVYKCQNGANEHFSKP
jgi:hypothetical protein